MAKKVRMTGQGYSPHPSQKIVQVNRNMGVDNIQNQQASTRVIYDAVKLSTTTVDTTISLFKGCKTRQFPLTNLTENKLQVGETMNFSEFSCYIIQCTSGTTKCIGINPLSFFPVYARLYGGTMSFNIAQNQVIKQLPLTSMNACFNSDAKFMGYYTTQPAAADPTTAYAFNHDFKKMDNDIVLPPNLEFWADITLPPIDLASGFDTYFAMKIEGLGSLFAPKSAY